jgi:uncharacterized protein
VEVPVSVTTISKSTTVHRLLDEYPFLLDYLVDYNPKFSLLRNPVARATLARVATLEQVASMGNIPIDRLLDDIERAIQSSGRPVAPPSKPVDEEDRVETLKEIIKSLHEGEDPDRARERFDSAFHDVDHGEIVAMEERLIRDGMPPQEIQRLCDLHVATVRRALEKAPARNVPPGHPVLTFKQENEAIVAACNELTSLAGRIASGARGPELSSAWDRLDELVRDLATVDRHYLRKEHQIFPLLEKSGVTGPSQVMWGIHDEIREMLKATKRAVDRKDSAQLATIAPKLTRAMVEMAFKEDNILFPMTLDLFQPAEWKGIEANKGEIGIAFGAAPSRGLRAAATPRMPAATSSPARPTAGHAPLTLLHRRASGDAPQPTTPPMPVPDSEPTAPTVPRASSLTIRSLTQKPHGPETGSAAANQAAAGSAPAALHELKTGLLTIEQLDLVMRHLPVDITFVNENDEVAYFSEGKERIFPRLPEIIGRKVQNCHPPKSVHIVNRILEELRAGRKDEAEFWIELQGKLVHIRYFAVRDVDGNYRGTLEVTQDITGIRKLEGQRRLLDWTLS